MITRIDEKIERIVEFSKKYPGLWRMSYKCLAPKMVGRYLGKDATEEEKKELENELVKIRDYYNYIQRRELTKDQIEKLKNADICDFIGETDKEKGEDKQLMEKYGIDPATLQQIKRCFGTIERFKEKYIEAFLENNLEKINIHGILNKLNLVSIFDIKSGDLRIQDNGYWDLFKSTMDNNSNFPIINTENLKQYIEQFLDEQKEADRKIIETCYGLNGIKRQKIEEIALEKGVSNARIWQLKRRIILKLAEKINREHYNTLEIDTSDYNQLVANFTKEYFENHGIFLQSDKMDEEDRMKTIEKINELKEEKKKNDERKIYLHEKKLELIDLNMPIEKMCFSTRTFNYLKKRGIQTLKDIIDLNLSDLEGLRSKRKAKKIGFDEVKNIVHSIGLKFRNEENYPLDEFCEKNYEEIVSKNKKIINREQMLKLPLQEFDFSAATRNSLARAGLFTLEDVVSLTEEGLLFRNSIGKVAVKKIKEEIGKYGFELKRREENQNDAQELGKATFPAIQNIEESDKVQELLKFIREEIDRKDDEKSLN